MPRHQLNIRLDPALDAALRAAADEAGLPPSTLVRHWLEARLGLSSGVASATGPASSPSDALASSSALDDRLAGIEQRLEALEASRTRRARPAPSAAATPPPIGGEVIPQAGERPARPSGAITTAELAQLSSTNRAGWNNWAGKAQLGDVRHHPEAGGWRLVGKAPADAGGPARWLWEQA